MSKLLIGVLLCLSACSSTPPVENDPKHVTIMKPSPTPPEPKKEPGTQWICRVLNNEGRTFSGRDDSSFMARTKALHQCELSSKHCSILQCLPVEEE